MGYKEKYLEGHSRDIAAIIHKEWTKELIFAWCEYKDANINENLPDEPRVTDSGLARQHLVSGYEHAWNFYEQGKAESVMLCSEIKKIIDRYEKIVYDELDKEIQTSIACAKIVF